MLLDELMGVLDDALHEERCHIAHEIFKLIYFLGVALRNFAMETALSIVNRHIDLLHRSTVLVLDFIFGLLAVMRDVVRFFALRTAAT